MVALSLHAAACIHVIEKPEVYLIYQNKCLLWANETRQISREYTSDNILATVAQSLETWNKSTLNLKANTATITSFRIFTLLCTTIELVDWLHGSIPFFFYGMFVLASVIAITNAHRLHVCLSFILYQHIILLLLLSLLFRLFQWLFTKFKDIYKKKTFRFRRRLHSIWGRQNTSNKTASKAVKYREEKK